MTKLVIQIPCFNEAETLPDVLAEIPAAIPGVDETIVLVVDDGSSDDTVKIARRWGARVVGHPGNRGLSATFAKGLDESLRLGADVIVNIDGDHQYPAARIPDLVRPILDGHADIVLGDRGAGSNEHFSPFKRLLQRLGSWTVRRLSDTDVPDAPSGFRAFSREAALHLNVIARRTYTLETLIQAGAERFKLDYVPIRTNPPRRPSRLHRGSLHYVWLAVGMLLRARTMYSPLKLFLWLAALLFAPGAFLVARFLYFFVTEGGAGHIQSLVVAAVLLNASFFCVTLGIISELISANRRLSEEALFRLRRLESDLRRAGLLHDPDAATLDRPGAEEAGALDPVAAVALGRGEGVDRPAGAG